MTGAYFLLFSDALLHRITGRFLDQDIIYLEQGGFLRGKVIKELDQEILVETENGLFTLPRSSCKVIEKDLFFRYLRQML